MRQKMQAETVKLCVCLAKRKRIFFLHFLPLLLKQCPQAGRRYINIQMVFAHTPLWVDNGHISCLMKTVRLSVVKSSVSRMQFTSLPKPRRVPGAPRLVIGLWLSPSDLFPQQFRKGNEKFLEIVHKDNCLKR